MPFYKALEATRKKSHLFFVGTETVLINNGVVFFHLLPLPLISTCPRRRKDLMNCQRMGLALPSQGSCHVFILFFQVKYGKCP